MYDLRDLGYRLMACELVAVIAAVSQRKISGGGAWQNLHRLARTQIPDFTGDRAPGPDIESALPEVRQLGLKLILSHQSFSQL